MLGQKDYQQILVIRQIIKDFFFKTKIIDRSKSQFDVISSLIGSDKFNEIRKIIERLHNYETPEIISLEILESNEKYLKWIQNEID